MFSELFSRNFSFVIISNFFLFLCYLSYQLLPLHIKALGGGEGDIGWVMGVPNAVSVLLMPVFGVWVDRLGRKPFILLGQCCVALPALGFLLAGDVFPLFAGLRMVQNIGIASAMTAAGPLVAEMAPEGRLAQAIGIYGVSGLITHAVAPAIGEGVIALGGFHALFAVTLIYGMVGGLAASRLSEPTPAANPGASRKASLRAVLATTGFGQILFLGFVLGASVGSVMTYVPTYIRDLGIQWISLFYIVYALTAAILRLGFGRLPDRVGHKRVIFPAFGALAAGVLVLSRADAQWMFGLAGLLNGFSHGLLFPALTALAMLRAGRRNLGKAQSLFAASFSAGMTIGIFANGLVADFLGYGAMFALLTVWIGVGLTVFQWLEKDFPRERSHPTGM